MYFIGGTSTRGTYYFHSSQLSGWVVADLDACKASLHDRLATVEVGSEYDDVVEVLERRSGFGNDGKKWLVDGHDLFLLLRDFAEELTVLMVYHADGSQMAYGESERDAAKAMRRIRESGRGKDVV